MFGRLILYSMILPLSDVMTLCVYDGFCFALALGLDVGVDCCFALEGTREGTRFAPFCPLYTIFGVEISMWVRIDGQDALWIGRSSNGTDRRGSVREGHFMRGIEDITYLSITAKLAFSRLDQGRPLWSGSGEFVSVGRGQRRRVATPIRYVLNELPCFCSNTLFSGLTMQSITRHGFPALRVTRK